LRIARSLLNPVQRDGVDGQLVEPRLDIVTS
jgi:hypothetical protein